VVGNSRIGVWKTRVALAEIGGTIQSQRADTARPAASSRLQKRRNSSDALWWSTSVTPAAA